MPAASDIPLKKVTLNLFAADITTLVARYGYGWTEQIRLLVHKDCESYLSLKHTLDEEFDR